MFKEVWLYMKFHKKWWLGSIILFLVVLGIVIVFAESSVFAPLIYTLF